MLNAEGYPDPTAYNAIFKGGNNMIDWKDGDIIKMHLPDGRDVVRIVLKTFEKYATTLTLFDDECRENEFTVRAGKMMHADLGKIAFTRHWDMENADLIRSMKEEELSDLLSRIGDCIGVPPIIIPEDNSVSEELKGKIEEIDSLKSINNELTDKWMKAMETIKGLMNKQGEKDKALEDAMEKLSYATEQAAASRAGVIKAEAERDVYKELYMSLLKERTA